MLLTVAQSDNPITTESSSDSYNPSRPAIRRAIEVCSLNGHAPPVSTAGGPHHQTAGGFPKNIIQLQQSSNPMKHYQPQLSSSSSSTCSLKMRHPTAAKSSRQTPYTKTSSPVTEKKAVEDPIQNQLEMVLRDIQLNSTSQGEKRIHEDDLFSGFTTASSTSHHISHPITSSVSHLQTPLEIINLEPSLNDNMDHSPQLSDLVRDIESLIEGPVLNGPELIVKGREDVGERERKRER
eukprot:sb/3469213/